MLAHKAMLAQMHTNEANITESRVCIFLMNTTLCELRSKDDQESLMLVGITVSGSIGEYIDYIPNNILCWLMLMLAPNDKAEFVTLKLRNHHIGYLLRVGSYNTAIVAEMLIKGANRGDLLYRDGKMMIGKAVLLSL